MVVFLPVIFSFANHDFFAGSKTAPDPKDQATALGVRHKAIVTLSDGSEVKGKIAAIDADSVTIDKGKSKGVVSLRMPMFVESAATACRERRRQL